MSLKQKIENKQKKNKKYITILWYVKITIKTTIKWYLKIIKPNRKKIKEQN